jgi:hypothetical protein
LKLPANSLAIAARSGADAWSIHKGGCGYGWLDKDVATGGMALQGVVVVKAACCAATSLAA